METILQTTNLSRQFGKKMAVNNVNMTIHKGDIYGFIGKTVPEKQLSCALF